MGSNAKSPSARAATQRHDTYRGVTLLSPASPSKTPVAKLQRAVEHAVAKNADALAGRK